MPQCLSVLLAYLTAETRQARIEEKDFAYSKRCTGNSSGYDDVVDDDDDDDGGGGGGVEMN